MTPKEKAQELVDKIYNYTVDVFILSQGLRCTPFQPCTNDR